MQLERLKSCLACGSSDLNILDPKRRLSGCCECHFVFDNPRPTTEEIVAFYSRPSKYDHWVGNERARREMWARRLRKLGRFGAGGAVLDVGAGIGEFLHYAGNRFSERVGTEVSQEAVKLARERFGIELMHGEFESAQFDQTFDLVTLFHVLEHVPYPRQTLERCHEVLRPGGHLVVAVPNDRGSLKLKLKGMLSRLNPVRSTSVGPLGLPAITLDENQEELHLSHFGPAVLGRLVQTVGFQDVRLSLDPYYAEVALRNVQHQVRYAIGSFVLRATGKNLYDTIWLEARRPEATP